MGSDSSKSQKHHGVKDKAVFDSVFSDKLGKKNVKTPKFIKTYLTSDNPTNNNIEVIKITPPFKDDSHKFCITIKNVFTKSECLELIKLSEKQKYGPAYVRTKNGGQMLNLEGRNNSRVMIDSKEIANYLFIKCKNYIPKLWPPKTYDNQFNKINDNEKSKLIEFNERLRFLRYNNGEYFKLHKDGCFKRENGNRSYITCLIYLSQGFIGGETILWDIYNKENNIKIKPEIGMVLLFDHLIWHEGNELIKGKKYIIRTDVMYTK